MRHIISFSASNHVNTCNCRYGDWQISKKLDEGGFGKIFLVTNIRDPTRKAALKAESSNIDGGAAIKLEVSGISSSLTSSSLVADRNPRPPQYQRATTAHCTAVSIEAPQSFPLHGSHAVR